VDPTESLPVAVYSFREVGDEFDWETKTFQSGFNRRNGVPCGLSLRKHPPGHPQTTIAIVRDVPPPEEWSGDVVYFIKAESIVTGSCIEDVVKSTDQLTPSRCRGPFESR
jgi:hypothetical protein